MLSVLALPICVSAQNFGQSSLNFNGNGGVNKGTSLEFGPDGRLYVLQLDGTIDIFTIQRNGPNDYVVTASEEVNLVKSIPNHNDDGSSATGNKTNEREATGITVVGTAANPVMYVTSSDARTGGPGGDLNLDTNSGVITRLTWNGSAWVAVDIVRGLPRSEENHATNGLEFATVNGINYLIVCSGGHTNGGAPSKNFAWTTEYALAAAVLSVNLTQLQGMPILNDGSRNYIYDIPTLDDPTRPNVNGITDPNTPGYNGIDVGDPWGGNDGMNQAMIVPGGPVQIFSPGYRNAYDLVYTQSGAVYVTDNGANGGWGGLPENEGTPNVNNNWIAGEPGSSSKVNGEGVNNKDHLHIITNDIQNYTFGSFYGGHPVPVRANPVGAGLYTNPDGSNTSPPVNAVFRTQKYDPDGSTPGSTTNINIALPANWPPVPVSMANVVEGDFRAPGDVNPDGPNDDLVTIWGTNTNGIDEYTASNFGGAMQGNLIAGKNGGVLRRVRLNPDGSLLELQENFITGFGGNALGITCQGDADPFPGTIWVAPFDGSIKIMEPQDLVVCVNPGDPGYDPNGDNDGDGYTNQDEIDNGTDICSGGSQPNDHDKAAGGTLISDLNDLDDDNDGILDANDPFQLGDPLDAGSDAFPLPVINELYSDNEVLKGYLGLGLTGLMNNGDPNPNWLNWLDRRDDPADPNPNDILGGAVGAMTMQMGSGTAKGAANNQEKAFQYGVQVDLSTNAFSVEGKILSFDDPLQLYGTPPSGFTPSDGELGIFMGDGTQSNFIQVVITKDGIEAFQEINDVPQSPLTAPIPLADRPTNSVIFNFNVVSATGVVTVRYSLDGDPFVVLGNITAQGSILTAIQQSSTDLAVGFIGTSNVVGAEVEGTWDYLNVRGAQPTVLQTLPNLNKLVNAPAEQILLTNFFDDDQGVGNLTFSVETNTNTAIGASISGSTLSVTFPATAANTSITIRATDQDGLFVEQTFAVSVTDQPVVIFRVNAGDVEVTATDAPNPNWAANTGTGAQSGVGFSVNTGNIGTHNNTNMHSSVPAYAPAAALFAKERWDPGSAPEMMWTFNTGNGNFLVNLFMANGAGGTQQPGTRLFNVLMEGVQVITNKDLSAEYGHKVGAMETYPVTVNDGVLNIEFIHVLDNPVIYAIEILGAGAGPSPITVDPIASQTFEEGDIVNLPVLASGGNPAANFSYVATGLPTGLQIEPTTGLIFGTVTSGASANSPFASVVTVSKPGSADFDYNLTWNITAPVSFPVTWLGLEARYAREGVAVSWSTASEFNSDYYQVERSDDNGAFEAIGKVQAVGNAQETSEYSFLDRLYYGEKLRYRIRQVDLDGGYEYSKIIQLSTFGNGIMVFPNPFDDQVTLLLPEGADQVRVRIYDMTGRLWVEQSSDDISQGEVKISLDSLTDGVYLLMATLPDGRQHPFRIVKQKN